jgi:hypothetical protein
LFLGDALGLTTCWFPEMPTLLADVDCTDFARNGGIGSQSVGATTFGERNWGVFSDDVPEIKKNL